MGPLCWVLLASIMSLTECLGVKVAKNLFGIFDKLQNIFARNQSISTKYASLRNLFRQTDSVIVILATAQSEHLLSARQCRANSYRHFKILSRTWFKKRACSISPSIVWHFHVFTDLETPNAEQFFEPKWCSPPILALKATPTPHTPLLAAAATSPAHRVPCLPKHKRQRSERQLRRKQFTSRGPKKPQQLSYRATVTN